MTTVLASAALPLLRRIDPERAHRLALRALRAGLGGRSAQAPDPALATTALGLSFATPIGLAAGFDKDGTAIAPLMRLGFGHVEIGSVTPKPQAGNPRPRLFRLTEDRAVINRMGFNNDGIDALIARLRALPNRPAILGVNIGLNKQGGDPERDYPAMAATLAGLANYLVVNVSSPNTPGLRDLQAQTRLDGILRAIGPTAMPLLVKVAPDLAPDALLAAVETCAARGVAGMIVSNTTTARAGLRSPHARQVGGLSGAPLFKPSTAMLARAWLAARGRVAFIGCGGVRTGEDAFQKLLAGASLVQLYTEFAYAGPALIPRLNRELAACLRATGFATPADAVGQDADRLAR